MLRFVALVALLVGCPALAQVVYRWVDDDGLTHYTDDAASVPKGAVVFATSGEPISELGKPGPVPAIPAPAAGVVEPPAADPGPAVPGASEQYWRGQFREVHRKLRALEDEISADRVRTEEQGGLPVSTTYACAPAHARTGRSGAGVGPVSPGHRVSPFQGCMPVLSPAYDQARQRLERNRRALERAKEELHELERRASFEAVPLEWRR